MSHELSQQKKFWDKETESFDAIYSHSKSPLSNFLDRIFRWEMYKRFEYTMQNSQPITDHTFLDVGCGTGQYSLAYAQQNARFVVGLDISENMIRTCQKRAQEKKYDNRTLFLQTDLLHYQPESTFDVCIGIGLFDYIKDPLPVLTKMKKCVHDRVIMAFPRLLTWRAPVRKMRLFLKNCDVYFYTKPELDDLIMEAGFTKYNLETMGCLYCVTAFI